MSARSLQLGHAFKKNLNGQLRSMKQNHPEWLGKGSQPLKSESRAKARVKKKGQMVRKITLTGAGKKTGQRRHQDRSQGASGEKGKTI